VIPLTLAELKNKEFVLRTDRDGSLCDVDHRLRILIADDLPDSIFLLTRMLNLVGYENIQTAASGTEVLSATHRYEFDAILLNWEMPGMTGIETLRVLKKNRVMAFIAIVTAHAMKTHKDQCIEAGFDAVITKPFSSLDLRKALGHLRRRPDETNLDAF